MAEAAIPVDLFNPGQVFACLGFLEAADMLLGDAEGGFDWTDESQVRFVVRTAGDENPFAVVLRFLAEAEVWRRAPIGYNEPTKKKAAGEDEDDDSEASAGLQNLVFSEVFPDCEGNRMALPIRLEGGDARGIDVGHWADGSSRNEVKLYAGNRSAYGIACDMLRGKRGKPTRTNAKGPVLTQGIDTLWSEHPGELLAKPFDVLTLMGGSFNFDPRGAWTALDAGYSPNEHEHGIAASPVVEILAPLGLEHARPDEYQTRQVRYGVWGGLVPPILARPALAGTGSSVPLPMRRFRFVLELSGKNKVVTFAQEEVSK